MLSPISSPTISSSILTSPSLTNSTHTPNPAARIPASHSHMDVRIPDWQSHRHNAAGLSRSSSLVTPSAKIHGKHAISHSPTLAQPRIFPGIVHERHRRGSIRQGSGSETDGDSMTASGTLSDRKRPKSSDMDDVPLSAAVLEEAAEDV